MSESKRVVTPKYDVGDDKKMTISEIVELTSISRQNIRKRILNGMTGAALLEPAHDKASTGAKGSWIAQRWAEAEARGLTPEEQRVKARCNPRLLPSGVIADDFLSHIAVWREL